MKTVKILLAMVLALGMVLTLAACGGEEAKKETTPATTAAAVVTPTEEVATEATTEETTAPQAEASVETEATEANPAYTVTVVDEGGNPVAGVIVQLCAETCFPGTTDEQGVATFQLEEMEYKVSVLKCPEGYEVLDETNEFYFDQGSLEMTVTLKAIA